MHQIKRSTRVLALCAIGAFALACAPAGAAPSTDKTRAAAMDALLQRYFKPGQAGAAVLVQQNGAVLFKRGYGLASLELRVPVKTDTVFHVASVSKQFTAAAILRLAEQGRLDIAAPVSRYLADIPPAWAGITIQHLLTHTSGIDNLFNDAQFRQRVREDLTPEQLLAYAAKRELLAAPGARHQYASVNYSILGMVIARLSGMPYEQYVSEQFLQPLGMKHTHFDVGHGILAGQASPYEEGPIPAHYISPSLGYAAGSFFSSNADIALWSEALAAGKVLSKASVAAMNSAFKTADGRDTHYGYGMRVHHSLGQTYLQSNGDIFGFHTETVRLPQAGVFVSIMHNSDEHAGELAPLAKRLAAIAIGQPIPPLRKKTLAQAGAAPLIGRYDAGGNARSISYVNGQLFSEVPGFPPSKIHPLSPSEFFFDDNDDARLEFVFKDGKVVALKRYDIDREPWPTYMRAE
ncbi:serine hydrolase domain-containing protein [Janthinobacterium sp.]|uniref:serine hydrolase domain-containing protein n=1 Tax=Janthinobacterium sp. TaxID=1871054 RepID=UPI00293D4923|nr:serine hydrolase domain-containing protein [Janthinobacterium sp.]